MESFYYTQVVLNVRKWPRVDAPLIGTLDRGVRVLAHMAETAEGIGQDASYPSPTYFGGDGSLTHQNSWVWISSPTYGWVVINQSGKPLLLSDPPTPAATPEDVVQKQAKGQAAGKKQKTAVVPKGAQQQKTVVVPKGAVVVPVKEAGLGMLGIAALAGAAYMISKLMKKS